MEEILKNPFYQKNYIPILSFTIGTILLSLYAITKINMLPIIGLFYVYLALFINFCYLIAMIILHFIEKRNNQETLIRIGIALCNIPITLFYMYLVFNVIH
ncbi:hypothetical protein [uncultured Flavobacterium sp.]|uniref:hypothetical protein n=1 Tax=uncultured Flavobacterium sp. TaxID=165435 RepID=UPI0030EE694F